MSRLLVASMMILAACGSSPDRSHSPAADALIAAGKTPEERAELTRVRDEIDDAARRRIDELDAEIERLERENAELRRR